MKESERHNLITSNQNLMIAFQFSSILEQIWILKSQNLFAGQNGSTVNFQALIYVS
jgi:hypothetical protein